jgi:hypothetical protein
MSTGNSGELPTGRIMYTKQKGEETRRVVYDRDADGSETFADQAMHEARWHPFEPSDQEREAARWLLAQGKKGGELPKLEDALAQMGQQPAG